MSSPTDRVSDTRAQAQVQDQARAQAVPIPDIQVPDTQTSATSQKGPCEHFPKPHTIYHDGGMTLEAIPVVVRNGDNGVQDRYVEIRLTIPFGNVIK